MCRDKPQKKSSTSFPPPPKNKYWHSFWSSAITIRFYLLYTLFSSISIQVFIISDIADKFDY